MRHYIALAKGVLLLSKGPGPLIYIQLDQLCSSATPPVTIQTCHNVTRLLDLAQSVEYSFWKGNKYGNREDQILS